MASLDSITDPPGPADVFWAAGDVAFLRRPSRPPRGSSRFMQGLVDVRSNLNYHLLMHRRLFVTDTSLLLTAPVVRLLTRPESGYQALFQEQAIVPAMRATVDSFSELAEEVIAGGNYTELSPQTMTRLARRLDEARPRIAYTASDINQTLFDQLAEDALIQPIYWSKEIERPFDRATARALIRSVIESMHKKGRTSFRQTEFWEFAEQLHIRNRADLAQMIRVETTIHSIGAQAINLGLPLVVPAAYAEPAGRIYQVGSPIRDVAGGIELTPGAFPDQEILDSPKATIYQLARDLTPAQIIEIRGMPQYKNYIRSVQRADSDMENAPGILEHALLTYVKQLSELAGAASEGRFRKLRLIQSASRWSNAARWRGPAAVGLITRTIAGGRSADPAAVQAAATGGAAAFLWMLDRGISRRLKKEETRAQLAQARLRRQGTVKVEFFGPADKRYWWLYGDRPPGP